MRQRLPMLSAALTVFVVALIAAAVGCASEQSGAPGDSGDGADRLATYVVVTDDAVIAIADRHGVSTEELVAVNDWPDGVDHVIHPGDTILLPAGATPPRPRPESPGPTTSQAMPGGDDTAPSAAVDATYSSDFTRFGSWDGERTNLVDPSWVRSDGTLSGVADGVYYAIDAEPVDGGIEFRLAAWVSAEACIDDSPLGAEDDGCYGGVEIDDVTGTMTMPVEITDVTACHVDLGPGCYLVGGSELHRLLSGESPGPRAPEGFRFGPWPSFVLVRDGEIVGVRGRQYS